MDTELPRVPHTTYTLLLWGTLDEPLRFIQQRTHDLWPAELAAKLLREWGTQVTAVEVIDERTGRGVRLTRIEPTTNRED